ncbi:hypothetical protein DPMN_035359 [Dreissena polymorpha]|uniref:Uncharacterized protein n=1 Tax=Dreissena polymorpha TaxID=45954 RepID=A0A9D4RMW9_DREPO|nr:hypothetical protein DPMN_035359 [Dreissena polymorpha]
MMDAEELLETMTKFQTSHPSNQGITCKKWCHLHVNLALGKQGLIHLCKVLS